MNEVIDAVKKDLRLAMTLANEALQTSDAAAIAIVAGLIGEERRRKKALPAPSRVSSDPVEVARKNPRPPVVPAAAIGTGTRPAAKLATKTPVTTKTTKAAKRSRPRKT